MKVRAIVSLPVSDVPLRYIRGANAGEGVRKDCHLGG
jgi:hypothetical protein